MAYRDRIRQLESLLQDESSHAAADQLESEVLDVLSESARHELAARYLHEHERELAAIADGLREVSAILTAAPPLSEGVYGEGPSA